MAVAIVVAIIIWRYRGNIIRVTNYHVVAKYELDFAGGDPKERRKAHHLNFRGISHINLGHVWSNYSGGIIGYELLNKISVD